MLKIPPFTARPAAVANTADVPSPHAQAHLVHPNYRPDIDGLRGIAVLSVVLFHAFPTFLQGGFVGVDIFFVISGFLISTIIFGSLARGSFSFTEFYVRRIRRIFPALLVVLVAVVGFGWFTLLADEYKHLGKHLYGGAGFFANFLLQREAGYFDTSAESKPLLHLWSLSVEEQFYIAWPFLLWLAWRLRVRLLPVILLLLGASFVLNVASLAGNPVATFYSPQTRFWELLGGALLAYLPLRKQGSAAAGRPLVSANARAWLGGCLMAFALLLISRERGFPGWWAAMPTLGAALLISAGTGAWVNRHILSSRVLVAFGLISYPLYLWHWPLLAFARVIGGEEAGLALRCGAVALSVAFAWLTWRVVERPLRFGPHGQAKALVLAALMLGAGTAGYFLFEKEGLPAREIVQANYRGDAGGVPDEAEACRGLDRNTRKLFLCLHDRRAAPRYALLGDSKAIALYPGLMRTSGDAGRWLVLSSGRSGPLLPVLSDNAIYGNYQKKPVNVALELIAGKPEIETVVLAVSTRALFQLSRDDTIEDLPASANYAAARDGLRAAVGYLAKAGKRVVLLVDNPTLPDPKVCVRRTTALTGLNALFGLETPLIRPHCELPLALHLQRAKPYRDLLRELEAHFAGKVEVFDPSPLLCDMARGVCPPVMDGRLVYGFTDHVSDHSAGLIGRELNAHLAQRSAPAAR